MTWPIASIANRPAAWGLDYRSETLDMPESVGGIIDRRRHVQRRIEACCSPMQNVPYFLTMSDCPKHPAQPHRECSLRGYRIQVGGREHIAIATVPSQRARLLSTILSLISLRVPQ